MIHDLKPYPAYKDSGVPWLGEMPAHWEIERVKNRVINVIEPSSERRAGELYVALENVESWTGRLRKPAADVVFDSQVKRFQADDVLFGKLRPYLAKVSRPGQSGVCVGEFFVLRPRGCYLQSDYLACLMRSGPVIDAINSSTFGAKMPRADWQFVGNLGLPFPPVPEQSAIVRFLDHADRRIQRYIRVKKKLIALVNEQKQAIIHRAVTRGLDPNVRLKPSGVEWLGEVPEHWEMRKLGHIATVFNGTTPSRMQPAYWQGGNIPWLASGKVNDYLVETPSEFVTDRALRECSISLVPKGSVILGLVGQGRTRGMSALLGIDACINQNLAAIVPHHGVDGRFLHHLLTALYKSIREIGRGGNQEALNCDLVARLRLPLPPLDEQSALCGHLNNSLAGLVCALRHAEDEINLLHEYRTRLIADVVTGKLDVREAAARLPDEVEEPEPLAEDEALAEGDNEGDGVDFDPEEAVA